MNCCYKPQTTASAQLIPSATASAYANNYLATVTQNLCSKACCGNSNVPPSYNLEFTYTGYQQVGNTILINVAVTGTVVYPVSCNSCSSCGNNTALIAANITIPISSTTVPSSVVVTAGSTVGNYDVANYKKFVMQTPLAVTFVAS